MKIIFLNAWHGHLQNELRQYLIAQLPSTDIFCFQEAYDDMQRLAADVLLDYTAYADNKQIPGEHGFPQATYVHKRLNVLDSGSVLQDKASCGLGIYVHVQKGDEDAFVVNFHGMARPAHKRDSPERLQQSRGLIDFLADKQQVVLGGDFNMLPEATSIQMFTEAGYRNLVTEQGIITTRNQLAWDQYPEPQYEKQYHSDYVFLSPDLTLKSFTVSNVTVSDHLPLEVIVGE